MDEILYHYCSTEAFYKIIESKSLWLSSLSQSNDYMEGKLVSQIIEIMATKDNFPNATIARVLDLVRHLEGMFDGLGFCLSEEGDLLSQWRGYAANATGISIGFSKKYLDWLVTATPAADVAGLNLQKIVYDPVSHEKEIEPIYKIIKESVDKGAFQIRGRSRLFDDRNDEEIKVQDKIIEHELNKLSFAILGLFPSFFIIKSKAFLEEREWRLISYLASRGQDKCSHRLVEKRITPYRSYEIKELHKKPIVKVILGPKHSTPIEVVQDFLRQSGFDKVEVIPSSATYR